MTANFFSALCVIAEKDLSRDERAPRKLSSEFGTEFASVAMTPLTRFYLPFWRWFLSARLGHGTSAGGCSRKARTLIGQVVEGLALTDSMSAIRGGLREPTEFGARALFQPPDLSFAVCCAIVPRNVEDMPPTLKEGVSKLRLKGLR